MDVIAIISQYLRDNRHLVVPTFGVFVAKESGEVLFSDLVKTDDGILRSLLAEQGLGEVAAAGAIDHFIFDARYAIDETGRFEMGALGTLVKGADGVVRLVQTAVAPTVAASQPSAPTTPAAQRQPAQPTAKGRPSVTGKGAQEQQRRRRGVDWFMIVAILILLAAIAVVGYGYYCSTERAEADDAMMEELRYHTEQPAPNK